MREIRIKTDKIEMLATLNDSPTAERLWDALPIESTVNTWGQEIYFSIPLQCDLESNARDRMEIGEIAYWPTGSAFCIFFGKTPASKGDEPRAASPVTPLGRCEGDVKVFRQVREGDTIRLERILPEEVNPPQEAPEPAEAEPPAADQASEPPAEAAPEGAETGPAPSEGEPAEPKGGSAPSAAGA